jgi:hypothetical protein
MLTDLELTGMRDTSDTALADTGTITRPGADTFDAGTGLITAGASTTIYTGSMRVRPTSLIGSEPQFGEEQVTLSRYVVTVPYDTTSVRIDDVVTVTESDDADLVERTLRVTVIPLGTFMLDKRFTCEVVE